MSTHVWLYWSGLTMNKLYVYLDDGSYFLSNSIGYTPKESVISELVFNTSMQGYQEIISDPSYCDQSVIFTYPIIGNYGVSTQDNESVKPSIHAILINNYSEDYSHNSSSQSLSQYLKENQIIAVTNLDTRYLTKKVRKNAKTKVIFSNKELCKKSCALLFSQPTTSNQIQKVSTRNLVHFPHLDSNAPKVVLIDFGYKKSILDALIKRNCDVTIVPYNTTYEEILSYSPHGVLLSNGPGDPMSIPEVLPTIVKLQKYVPLFCICMGHQLFALANGAKTSEMLYPHRGANHPVKDIKSGEICITAQNHSYCVEKESIDQTDLFITQTNLNDTSIEGLKHKNYPSFSVQYHPEAKSGPNDTQNLFDDFLINIGEMRDAKNRKY